MKRLGLSLLLLVAGGALVASCEQQLVVVDQEGGGGEGGLTATEAAVVEVSVGTAVTTSGVIAACGNAPAPQGELTPCESVSAASSGTAMLCLSCVQDEAGHQYFAQCLGGNCHCSVDTSEYCPCTVESETCTESCCPAPWGPF
jgi:hypothetical protein